MSRPTVKNRGIGAKRREAMRAEAEQDQQHTEEAAATPAAEQRPAPKKKTAGASETARLGVYMTAAEFHDAKAAYLSDWQAGGQDDTFGRWIGTVLENHAARSTAEREALSRPVGRSQTRTGSPRSFTIPTHSVERMREGVTADQGAGRWLSDSAWAGDAIAAAVEAARKRDGGQLPEPPARLPNRLRR
ncbi:hypothetical protein [Janibacter corallicola]|uniref:hypothetical protein n=1 Tax=Janibacter corallicola TaxID=415212 RepID=UPI00083113AE|nr:hypothetical protein [Janibacter corallicola]